jgi:hypothetical protein
MSSCCQLVGNLDLDLGCIISINTSSATEVIMACGEDPLEGPTTGTISISAYVSDGLVWVGCPSRAGVSIPFIRKYDCQNDKVYFIFSGQGQSFISGDIDKYVSLNRALPTRSRSISASAASGPTGLYMDTTQTNGYGLNYNGGPINFTTSKDGTSMSILGTNAYLQSFSLEAQPGQIPVVSYSFVYATGEMAI